MPTMYEIYEKHSFEYDQLVKREDYQKNLPKTLNTLFDFTGKTVLEFGTGTGRLTAMYAQKANSLFCFDRSQHMLNKSKINLVDYKDKIRFGICDNNDISSIDKKGDLVIEGWSFGHTVSDEPNSSGEKADELISKSLNLLKNGGTCIFIETLGTNVDFPLAPNESLAEFYRRLEQDFGFTPVEIPTDYRFETAEEAAEMCGFFFGNEAGDVIRKKGSSIIREYTGLWYKTT